MDIVPTELTVDRHLAGLGTAMTAFVRYADRAGLAAPVPTCPEWSVLDLVAHQGMIHRWARSNLLGIDPEDPEVWEREGRSSADPLVWLRDGAESLQQTVAQVPDDVRARVFLKDAPVPRVFWARRQCHETTIHAVDAQSAALGRAPKAEEVDWVDQDVALDGIDELLGGFLTRRRERLRTDEESVLVVAPDASPWWWEVSLGPRPALTHRRRGPVGEGDWVLTGTATELYLRLWNRGVPPESPAGDWREVAAVTWT